MSGPPPTVPRIRSQLTPDSIHGRHQIAALTRAKNQASGWLIFRDGMPGRRDTGTKAEQLLPALRRRADDDQDALLGVFKTGL